MVDITTNVTTNGETVDFTVYEDVGDTGTVDNQETVSGVGSGTNTYLLSSLSGGSGNAYYFDTSLSTADVTATPVVHSVTLTVLTAPSTPQNLTSTVSQDDITLDWDAVLWNGDTGHYDIKRAQSSGGSYTEITTVASGTTTYTDSGLPDGEQYFYVVEADNSEGGSGNSNETASTTALPAVTDLSVSNIIGDSADLSWTNPEDNATEKRVYLRQPDSPSGMDFDGPDLEAVEISGDAMDGLSDFTVCFRTKNDASGEYIFSVANSTTDNVLLLEGNGNTTWTHVAYTKEAGTGTTYENGVSGFSAEYLWGDNSGDPITVDGIVLGQDQDSVFGGYDDGQDHEGQLADVMIFNRALSQSEIQTISDGGLVSNGLVGYWPLDLNRSGTTPDLSENANDGTVNGATLTGPTVSNDSGSLSSNATSYSFSNLSVNTEYQAFLHTFTDDNEVRDT